MKKIKLLKIIENGGATLDKNGNAVDFSRGYQVSKRDCYTLNIENIGEILAAAIGYKKNIEVKRKKGEKYDYYKREAEQADRYADALRLAEQIASGELENGTEIITERIQADKEQQKRKELESNIAWALELLKEGNKDEHTVEQSGDVVIYRKCTRYQVFDEKPNGWGRNETLETVIAINIKTGEREQVTDAPIAEAYEFYKRVAA